MTKFVCFKIMTTAFDKIALQPFHPVSRSFIVNVRTNDSSSPIFQRVFSKSEMKSHNIDPNHLKNDIEKQKKVSLVGAVPYDNIFENDEEITIERKYVDGDLISNNLNLLGLTFAQKLNFAITLCNTLSALHKMGIVAKNISFNNIIMSSEFTLVLLDFGIDAIAYEVTVTRNNQDLLLLGPEGIKEGKRITSFKLDVWNLGAILYTLFFNEMPFMSNNSMKMMNSILNYELNFPKPKNNEEKAVIDLIHSMLNPIPNARPVADHIVLILNSLNGRKYKRTQSLKYNSEKLFDDSQLLAMDTQTQIRNQNSLNLENLNVQSRKRVYNIK